MARICSYCVMKNGIKGSEIKDKDLSDDETFANHLEEFHGIIVKRDGETKQQAIDRCALKGIVADESKCQCRDCIENRKNE